MRPFGETIFKHKMLIEWLVNKYHGKLIPVSTAIEVASRAMNFQTAYDFESCLAVMQEAFNVNDGYFVDSTSVVPVVRCKDCKYSTKWRPEESAKKFGQVYECVRGVLTCPDPNDFCCHGERKE